MIKKLNSVSIIFIFFYSLNSYSQFLNVSSGQLNFGTVYENAPDSLPLTLYNTIGRDVTITGIKFYETYGRPAFSTPYSWFTVANNDSVTLWIKFSPGHNIFHNSELIIENDGLRGCVAVDLIGQGKYSDAYYNPTENLSEENLKQSIKQLTGNGYVSLGYNVARDSMFMSIDNKKTNGQGAAQNTLECVYTGRLAVGYTDRTDCQTNFSFNTEHTFPQTFFSSMEPMRSDLHHLFPTDDLANNTRGNNPFNLVSFPTWSNGGSESDGTYFEPRDVHKGIAARAMFYFVLRYQNYNNFLNIQETALRNWHKLYPPTGIDKNRNNSIYSLQQNKNPFVDHPELIDRITSLSSNSVAPVVKSLDLPEDTILFGTIQSGVPVVYKYVVVNNGNDVVQLSNFNLTHPGELSFSSGGNDTTLNAGESLVINIRCTTTLPDSIRGSLTFNTNATGLASVSVPVFVNDPVFTGIHEFKVDARVYPNPFHNILNIDFINQEGKSGYELFDIAGKQVMTGSLDEERIIDLGNFTPGIYFLKITSSGSTIHKKIVKQ
jgi:hypothetical protein